MPTRTMAASCSEQAGTEGREATDSSAAAVLHTGHKHTHSLTHSHARPELGTTMPHGQRVPSPLQLRPRMYVAMSRARTVENALLTRRPLVLVPPRCDSV